MPQKNYHNMAIKTKNQKPLTETLSNITTSFMQELAKSSASADIMRTKMKNVYESNFLLKEFEPSKIRLVTAKVSIPVAFDEHKTGKTIDTGLSQSQVLSLVKGDLPLQAKRKIAEEIHTKLAGNNRNVLTSKELEKHIVNAGKNIKMKGFNPSKDLDISQINQFRNEWAQNKEVEQEARFIYKAEDLEKVNPDNIIRFDLTIDIS